MRTIAVAAAGCLALAATVLLFPSDAPRAAGGDVSSALNAGANGDVNNDARPGTNADAPSFGSATPTDRFVQSFQQQVSQELQSALAQSTQQQEERLRQFEEQQKEMSDQLQAMQQSLGSTQARPRQGSEGGEPSFAASDVEPPRVNARRSSAAESAMDGRSANSSVPPFLGALGESGGMAAGQAPEDPRAIAVSYSPGFSFAGRTGRPGDPNIAPHGFVEGRLLNGVVAILGGPDRESIVALHGSYQSANGFATDLDGCFALVQGRPEIAAGRIDFKLSRLTCNFPDGASRTWDAAGWLVDADGIRGVRAAIVENVGRKALAAAAGGAIGGAGQRLSQEQYQINTVSAGTGAPVSGSSSTFLGSTGVDAAGGAASGAANAIGQAINEYYNLFTPSLQVGGGTPVTVVLANDLRLPPSGKDITQTHLATP